MNSAILRKVFTLSFFSLLIGLVLTACLSGTSGNIPTTAILQSIAVTPANKSIPTGGAQQFVATATYGDGSNADITAAVNWLSTPSSVATVSASGVAIGVAAGSAVISATSGTVSGSNSFSVSSAVLQAIAVTPINPNITPGQTQQLTATGTYSDGSTANISSIVTWLANTPAIATVNAAGLATGITSGISSFMASIGIMSASTTPALTVEVEPNNSTATANTLSPNTILTGQLSTNLDLDYFKITAAGSGAISVAFTGSNLVFGQNGWVISILDSASTVLASVNCNIFTTLSACSQTVNMGIPAAGTYYVLVQAPTGTTTTNNSTSTYTLKLSFSGLKNSFEIEPNNTPATATSLTSSVTMTGQLYSNLDLDYFKITATGSGAISVAFTGSNLVFGQNGWAISILDSASTVIASSNCNTFTTLSSCSQTLPAGIASAGTYYVLVQAPTGTTSANNSTENYTLNVTSP